MNKIVVLIIILLTFLTAASAYVIVEHKAPMPLKPATQPNLELEIKNGFEEIQDVYVYYREMKSDSYQQLRLTDASAANPFFVVQLPVLMPNVQGYEYYFEIVRLDGNKQTLPEVSPISNPYRLMQEVAVENESEFVILSPMTNEVSTSDPFLLVISTYALGDKLAKESIRIVVNGVDVTSNASITDNLIVYKQPKPKAGNLNIQISCKTNEGQDISVPTMNFTVKRGNKLITLPSNMGGSLNFATNAVSTTAQDSSAVPTSKSEDSSLGINLYGGQGWFKFNGKMYLSTLEKKDRQPVNRYTLGLYVPSLDIIIGDNTPYFTSLTLNSTNIRGLYGKLYAKGFALFATYGQSKRAIDGQVTDLTPNPSGTFARDAAGLRMQFGSMRTFQWSLNVAKSKDIVSSLPKRFYQTETASGDSTITTQIAFPIDNLVMGTDMRISMLSQRLIIGLEGAGSLYNSNIEPGPISSSELETWMNKPLPGGVKPSDFENIFIINKNMEPIYPSIGNIAMQGYMRASFLKNYLSISYSQIGESFRSVTANYLQNDTRTINITDNYNFRNVAFFDAGLNLISDNLSDKKSVTSTYNNWFIQTLLRMKNLPYMRIGYHVNTGESTKNSATDTTYVDTSTENNLIDLGLGYDIMMPDEGVTNFDLTYNMGNDKDKVNDSYELKSNLILARVTSRFKQIPMMIRFAVSRTNQDNTYTMMPNQSVNTKSSSTDFGLHGEYKFWEEKLTPFADFKVTLLSGDNNNQSYRLMNFGARYMPFEQTTLTTNFGFKTYTNNEINNHDYNSFTWNLNLSQRF